jgi:hypothetical protein
LVSHAIFNCCAYTKRVDQIIFYKSSSFSIQDVAFWRTLPKPHALTPNICNNYFEINLTKIGFGNGGHCFAIIISLSHLCCVLARARITTFWSSRLYRTMVYPKMCTFILTWSWCQRPLSKIKSLPSLAFSTSFKCLVNNHLT